MPFRIEVALKPEFKDALGESIKRSIKDHLNINVGDVKTIKVYTVNAGLTDVEKKAVASGPFSDQVVQEHSIDRPLASGFDWLVEVGFKPGVTDNEGKTGKEAIEDRLGRKLAGNESVHTSMQYLISGKLTREQVESISKELLGNELIERFEIVDGRSWDSRKGIEPYVPLVRDTHKPKVVEINLDVSDSELIEISKKGTLALTLEEMKCIRDYFKDPEIIAERKKLGLGERPTDVELESLAQTWSEHCKHKIFNATIDYRDGNRQLTVNSLFKSYIRKSTEEISKNIDWLVSVFKDNAGVIKFTGDNNIAFKVETHNSPSALDPYGGAITGIVGVDRDAAGTGLGSKVIAHTDVLCFASPYYKGKLPPRIFHPRRIMEGVVRGIKDGGNKNGIPTINGAILFDDRYGGKPLVYCGSLGIMPAKINGQPSEVKNADPGDLIVMMGGRIGKDGIHGATFSSEELHEGSPATAVQIGDPITQKKMLDLLLEARDMGLYKCITDNGAGGLSSSVGEMAQFSGGCEIRLEKAPLKYHGLDPWEILLSEAQERMTLSVPPEKIDELMELCKRRGVEATVLGRFTGSKKFHALYGDDTVAYLDMDFLHDGLPEMKLEAVWKEPKYPEPEISDEGLTMILHEMLSDLNVASKEWVIRQYDHEVQGGSVIKPLTGKYNDGPGDAGVIRPVLGRMEGVAVSNGINPFYGDIDTYHMTANAIDEAIRNIIAVGGSLDQIALLDNFCWCDPVYDPEKTPDGHYKLAQLVRANMALYDYCVAYGTPCISGKDSMKNDYKLKGEDGKEYKISIPPTVLFSAVGVIPDVRKCVTMDAKAPGDHIYVIGTTKDELGGSRFYASLGYKGNKVPKVDAKTAKKTYQALSSAIQAGLVASCHDCSDGGLGVALAETCFAGGYGADIELAKVPAERIGKDAQVLFSESASRFVVTVSPDKAKEFERMMDGVTCAQIGMTRNDDRFLVRGLAGIRMIDTIIGALKDSWQYPLRW
ncbi:phosphoribosylformylglycinamidine synthase subunit PurL [Methanocella sp. CWC-04]|uniref:Phosphoribosylformylglycinamidine synthase subunit PurL n=1 Tax=Methanooceanicella nereidis TaxID=2052831 RepID=A0AAP2RFW2_9EURY|nr:phosphoribosylformylglycinamidine synthase subunit PurL [Methanocella sp. CWC-04]MCD1295472.1 phosphoribosylformylglycinamidine synthase subunit PurL [Methanocella sp. CWC-04]